MTFNNILLGTDPEIFLFNTKQKKFISAEGIIQGNKTNPFKISDVGHCIQLDNVMAEINVPPTKNPTQMYNDIQWVLYYIATKLPKDVVVAIKPSAEFSTQDLSTIQAQIFGCEPDYNAWTCDQNDKPRPEGNIRTAGGHIHVSYQNPDTAESIELIKAMDLFLGIPSLFLDKDEKRRKIYGKAGAFRITSYGVEYRTLSNFWIKHINYVKWMFKGVHNAITFLSTAQKENLTQKEGNDIQKAINTNDLELAEDLARKFNIKLFRKGAKQIKSMIFV